MGIAETEEYPFLSIVTPEGRFTFAIGKTPVRFTRNDPEYLPDRKIVISEAAMQQMRLIPDDNCYANIRWFFVFDTNFKSAADAVYFVGYSQFGDIVCQWRIPMEDAVTRISDTAEKRSEPVKQPKPAVKIRRVVADTDEEADEK